MDAITPPGSPLPAEGARLWVSGWVWLQPGSPPVEVRREMPVFDRDGVQVGRVAAVVAPPGCPEAPRPAATHLLLARLLPEPGYALTPIALVAQVDEAGVRLRITEADVARLPARRPR